MKTHTVAILPLRELACVLAALRYYQEVIKRIESRPASVNEIASGGGEFTPLSALEIDALCERLNLDDEPGEKHNERRELIAIARACIHQAEQIKPLDSGRYSNAQETTAPGQLRALGDAARATLTRCGIPHTNPRAPITTLRPV